MVDDTERRLNALFDALNCETLSKPVVEQLVTLTNGTFIVSLTCVDSLSEMFVLKPWLLGTEM